MNSVAGITGDWAIDRLIRCRLRRVLGTAVPPVAIRANSCRVGLSIWEGDVSANIMFSVVKDGVVYDIWETEAGVSRWMHFTLLEHGELPTLAWQITSNPFSSEAGVIEYILPEDVLHLLPPSLSRG